MNRIFFSVGENLAKYLKWIFEFLNSLSTDYLEMAVWVM
jgi:hypothetical protein